MDLTKKKKTRKNKEKNLNKVKYLSNACLNIVIRLETQQNRRFDNQTELILVPHLKSIFKCIYERCYSKRGEKTFYFESDCIFSFLFPETVLGMCSLGHKMVSFD